MLYTVLSKSLENGWRVGVRGRSRQRMHKIDRELWRFADDDFLPHGLAGGKFDRAQPVLLCTELDELTDQDVLVVIDGAEVESEEANNFNRVSFLFESRNNEEIAIARKHWKRLSENNFPLQYWAEDGSRWVKKAEANSGIDPDG